MNVMVYKFTKDNIAATGESVETLREEYLYQPSPHKDGTFLGLNREDYNNGRHHNESARFITVDPYLMELIKN